MRISVLLFPVFSVQKSSISTSFFEALTPIYLSLGLLVGRPIFAKSVTYRKLKARFNNCKTIKIPNKISVLFSCFIC
nr:MAG TPA: hypothetical protein [Caudoviricetes sp.]